MLDALGSARARSSTVRTEMRSLDMRAIVLLTAIAVLVVGGLWYRSATRHSKTVKHPVAAEEETDESESQEGPPVIQAPPPIATPKEHPAPAMTASPPVRETERVSDNGAGDPTEGELDG